MKNLQITFLGCFLLITNSLIAQRDKIKYLQDFDKHKIHFGFYLGLNQNDFKLDYSKAIDTANVNITTQTGFNVGLIADLRLYKNINLRFEPGLVSNSKTLSFTHISSKNDSIREVNSTYLHLPLVLKLSTNRMGNIRPYILSGISYDHNFSSNERNPDGFENKARTKTSNFMYELGIGIDIYFYYFKFSPSIRGVFALNNELKYDEDKKSPWTSPINFLGTRGIFLTLAFEGGIFDF